VVLWKKQTAENAEETQRMEPKSFIALRISATSAVWSSSRT